MFGDCVADTEKDHGKEGNGLEIMHDEISSNFMYKCQTHCLKQKPVSLNPVTIKNCYPQLSALSLSILRGYFAIHGHSGS